MLPQSEFESPMYANGPAPVAIAAITRDRALIGLLRSVVDPSSDLILVTSEAELTPHLNGRRVSVALLDSMFIEGDLAAMAERLRANWPDLVLVVVGTAEEQSKVAAQITSGVVYRFLHRPVSAPRVRLFVEAALRRHEVENVERTLEQVRPDFSRIEAPREVRVRKSSTPGIGRAIVPGLISALLIIGAGVAWFTFGPGKGDPATTTTAAVDSSKEPSPAAEPLAPAAETTPPPAAASLPDETPVAATTSPVATFEESANAPTSAAPAQEPPAQPDDQANLRPASTEAVVQVPDESTEPAAPVVTREQRLADLLEQAEAALQRGELASPPGRNAVALFMAAQELDPGNTLAKAGLVRVADRLLSAAERALTAGNVEDARNMVEAAETLTPATARGAFISMQIEMERERAAMARAKEGVDQDKLAKGAGYVRLANARLRSGDLIEPSGDNARYYIEGARELIPEDPSVAEATRSLQRQLLDRAAAAAGAGNAADTERWLAYADGAGAPRPDMTTIRRALQDTLIGARTEQLAALTRSFSAALSANRLLQPANDNAKAHLLELIRTDASSPAVASARQGLGSAFLGEARNGLTREDFDGAARWLQEAQGIGFTGADLAVVEKQIADARAHAAQRDSVVGANSLQRVEYVAPKFPQASLNRGVTGWVELEYTVRTDGSTGDIVVTNSSPRRTFDNAAITAVSQWRYKPVMRGGKPIEQRAAVRIRFAD